MSSRRSQHLAALVSYGLLSVVLTYPLITKIGTALPGGTGDPWLFYWNMWWVRQAVTTPGAWLMHSDLLYYPSGVNLYFHTLDIFDSLVTLPLQFLFNTYVAYNVAVLVAFTLSGWGAYLLARYLFDHFGTGIAGDLGDTSVWLAAFVAGFIFSFSPYHFAHLLGHLNLISMQWIPFYVLFLAKSLFTYRRRYLPLAAMFLIFGALSDWQYLMFLLVFTVVLFLFRLAAESNRLLVIRGDVARLGLVLGLFGVIVSPLRIPMLRESLTTTHTVQPPSEVVRLSADLLGFFAPSPFHPIWGSASWKSVPIYQSGPVEKVVSAGFLPLVLAFIGVWRHWRATGLWVVMGLVFFVLALGPVLHVNDITVFPPLQISIPLPYALLYKIPVLKTARAAGRFDVMFMLSLAVLSAWGLVFLVATARRRRWFGGGRFRLFIPLLALVVIGFEFLAVPIKMTSLPVPSFYHQVALEKGDFAIFDLPWSSTESRFMYYQTVHGKRIVGGYIARAEPYPFVQIAPIVQKLISPGLLPDITAVDLRTMGQSILNYYNIRYVVLHKAFKTPRLKPGVARVIQEVFGRPPDYEDELIAAYRVRSDGRALFLTLGKGWYEKELSENSYRRWMGDEATANIISSTGGRARIRLTATGFDKPRRVALLAGDNPVAEFTIFPGEFQSFTTKDFFVGSGSTKLRLQAVDPAESPKQLGMGSDSRRLSILVSRIEAIQ